VHITGKPIAVGVDGCKSGWIAAYCSSQGEATTSLRHFRTVDDLALWRDKMDDEVFVTIDIPIGLPESTKFRRCDEEARRRLGERRNAVFMPPGRYLLAARDHAEARQLVKERKREEPEARGIGARAWGLVPKIREVDEFLHVRPEHQEWLLEVHPEVCFLEWSGHLLRGKHSAVGQIERLRLVRKEFPHVERAILKDLDATDKVDLTDVLDAHAALWTALRRATNEHETLAEETLGGLRARMIV
jgi:predicted RNase H-like nuclease